MFSLVVGVLELGDGGGERANGGTRLHALAKRALFGIDRLGGKNYRANFLSWESASRSSFES